MRIQKHNGRKVTVHSGCHLGLCVLQATVTPTGNQHATARNLLHSVVSWLCILEVEAYEHSFLFPHWVPKQKRNTEWQSVWSVALRLGAMES